MKQLSSLLCGLSLCSLLFCLLLLLLPLQPLKSAAAPQIAIPKEQELFSFSFQQLDRILFKKENSQFCLINLGDRFVLERFEDLLLQTEALTSLLEHFPLSSIEEDSVVSPAIQIEIISTAAEPLLLSLQYNENRQILLNDGTQTYCYTENELEPLLLDPESFVDPSICSFNSPEQAFLTLSGALYEKPLLLSYYIEEQNPFVFCDGKEISPQLFYPLLEALCHLKADQIEWLSPTTEDLQFAGLDPPFCIVDAQLGGEKFSLFFSEPLDNGSVYFIKEGTPILYSVSLDKLPFLSATYETLTEEPLFTANYKDTTVLELSSEGQFFRFTKWDGQVLCNGHPIDEEAFSDLYHLCTTLIPKQAFLTENNESQLLLSLQLSYTNPQKSSDNIAFFSYNKKFSILSINGDRRFLVHRGIVDEILHSCCELME